MQPRKLKRRTVRASNLNATIGKLHAPLIYPSQTADYKKEQTANAVTCSCGDCGFKFTSVASINGKEFSPICANCGSGKVVSAKSGVIAVNEATLAAVHCQKCDTLQIQSAETATAMATGYHCITCGGEQLLTPEPEETAEDEAPQTDEQTDELSADADNVEEMPAEEIPAEEIPAEEAAEETVVEAPADIGGSNTGPVVMAPTDALISPAGSTVEGEPADSTTAEVIDEEVAEDEVEEEVEEDEDEDSFGVEEAEDGDLSDLADDDSNDDFPVTETSEDDMDIEEVEESELDDDVIQFDDAVELDAEEDGDQVQFELLPEEDAEDTELSFVYVGDKLNAFANGLHVATLSKEHAGKNADLFSSDVLVRSIVSSCRDIGIRKGLQSAGFKIVKVSLPIQALVAGRVKAAVAKVKAAQTASVERTADDWKQAIAVALSGLNKGFFAGKQNPLKSGLIAELSALGVRNPSKLVDKIFAAHGANFNASVLEIASDVQSKSIEIRNQLAETLDSANYMATAEEVEDEEVDDDEEDEEVVSVEARLNGHGHRIVKTASKEVTGSSRISTILASSGGSLFSR